MRVGDAPTLQHPVVDRAEREPDAAEHAHQGVPVERQTPRCATTPSTTPMQRRSAQVRNGGHRGVYGRFHEMLSTHLFRYVRNFSDDVYATAPTMPSSETDEQEDRQTCPASDRPAMPSDEYRRRATPAVAAPWREDRPAEARRRATDRSRRPSDAGEPVLRDSLTGGSSNSRRPDRFTAIQPLPPGCTLFRSDFCGVANVSQRSGAAQIALRPRLGRPEARLRCRCGHAGDACRLGAHAARRRPCEHCGARLQPRHDEQQDTRPRRRRRA